MALSNDLKDQRRPPRPPPTLPREGAEDRGAALLRELERLGVADELELFERLGVADERELPEPKLVAGDERPKSDR